MLATSFESLDILNNSKCDNAIVFQLSDILFSCNSSYWQNNYIFVWFMQPMAVLNVICIDVDIKIINAPFFCCTNFFEYLPMGLDQHGKGTFSINLKDTSFHILMDSLRLYLSPEHLLNFLSDLYRGHP